MRLLKKVFLSVLICFPAVVAPAHAATIIGGTTKITLTAAPNIVALGFSIAATGTGTLSNDNPPVATFDITGGTVNGGDAVIDHDGSGLGFTQGLRTLRFSNFRIDTVAKTVSGDIFLGDLIGSATGIFDIGPGLSLIIKPETAKIFTDSFGVPDLTGVVLGAAITNPVVDTPAVPEPATWFMLVTGFAFAGVNLRRRRSNNPEMRFQRGDLRVVSARRI